MTAIGKELLEALASPEGRALLREAFTKAAAEVVEAARSDELIDIEEAAEILKTTTAALYKKCSKKRNTAVGLVRHGGRLRFNKRLLLAGGK